MKLRKFTQARLSSFLICVLLVGMIVSGQGQLVFAEDAPQIELIQFGTTTVDEARGIVADSSGIYVVGNTYGAFEGSNLGMTDVYLRKYDLNGNVVWTRQFGSLDSIGLDNGYAVAVDSSGVYVVGTVYGTLPDKTYFGIQDAFVRKYDKDNGDILWTDQFGAGAVDIAYAIAVDSSGVYVAGEIQHGTWLPDQSSSGGHDCFLRKYDKYGNVNWTRQFGTAGTDWALAVAVHTSGVYVAGGTTGAFSGKTNAGNFDVFIRKFDTEGNAIWTDQFGSVLGDNARGIFADDSGIYITGDAGAALPDRSSLGNDDVFVRKYNTDGTVVWTDQFGTNEVDNAKGISGDSSGLYVSGYTAGALSGSNFGDYDVFVRKYNSAGDMAWTDQFGTAVLDHGNGICVNSGALYIAGNTLGALQGQTLIGDQDAFIGKYSLSQSTIYVNRNATGTNDGSSWINAFTSLQSALAAAFSGDQIWVAAGTYYPGDSGNRTATFEMKDGVAIYGGFAGYEPETFDLSKRDFVTNVTILSGDLDVDGEFTNNDAYHVVSASRNVTSSAGLDGFTVTGGNANGSNGNDFGGGLNVYYSTGSAGNPVLENLILTRNSAINGGGGANFDVDSGLCLTLTNVVFKGNQAIGLTRSYGGAIHAYQGDFTFINCVFSGNSSNFEGGAIYSSYSTMTLINTTFNGNKTSSSGGGAIFGTESNFIASLTNTILWDNSPNHLQGSFDARFIVSYSNVSGAYEDGSTWLLSGVTDGGNNIDSDPFFVTSVLPSAEPSSAGDLRLQSGSPCINVGNNAVVMATTDLDGNPRIANGIVDMGAYEYQGAVNTAAEILTYSLPGQVGSATINRGASTIDVTVPYGTDVTNLVADFTLSDGATAKVGETAQVSGTTTNNFSSPVTYVVTAVDGTTTKNWTVTVTVAASSAAEILTYSLPGQVGSATINSGAGTIGVTVPYGTEVTSLAANFTLSDGATAKVGETAQVSGTTTNNFSSPVTYVVTAADGTTTKDWTVTVTVAASSAAEILTYSLPGQVGSATINSGAGTIGVTVPYGTEVTSLVANFTISDGASAKVGETAQVSGTTTNNFSSPVTYVVTAADGTTTKDWTVTVTVAASSAAEILTYSLPEQVGSANINSGASTIGVTVPYGTDITSLVANFTISDGATAKVGETPQVSGTTTNNFSSPATYVVTAADGTTTKNWTVTVTVAASSAAEILTYSLPEQVGSATINSVAGTIGVTVPYGTDVTNLVADFTLSDGATAKVGETAQVSGTTTNNFSSPVTYVVTAADGTTTKDWTVTVTVAANNESPVVTTQPQNTTVAVGQQGTFTVEYTGSPEITFQWQIITKNIKKWSNIAGANSDSYTTPVATSEMNGNKYRVILSNEFGYTISDAANLTVTAGDAPVVGEANVAITTKEGTYDSVANTVTWAITVTNLGPDAAEGVVVTDKLSNRALSVITNYAYKISGKGVIVEIGTLNNGASVEITIVEALPKRATGEVSNTAKVTTTSYDLNLDNNIFTATVSLN